MQLKSAFHCNNTIFLQEFKTRSLLERHITVHTKEKKYVCGCGRGYTRPDRLRKHAETCTTTPTQATAAILKSGNLRGKMVGHEMAEIDDDISHMEDDAEEFDENGGILERVNDPLKSDDED